MLIKNSILVTGDNTGIKKVKCIDTKKSSKFAKLGDLILFSIKKIKKKKKLHKKKYVFWFSYKHKKKD